MFYLSHERNLATLAVQPIGAVRRSGFEMQRKLPHWNASPNAMRQLSLGLLVALLCLQLACTGNDLDDGSYPRKPIKVIVPFDAGGGSDTFTRIIQEEVGKQHLLTQPMVVVNVPGAGGSIGSRRVKNARPDGYTILQLHEGLLTSKYSGNTNYGPEAFAPIAATGSMPHIIAVLQESEHHNLNDLLETASRSPDSLVFAVGLGAPSHFAALMLQEARPGAVFRYSQSGGGAKRFASLLGGHTDVTTFSIAEYVEFKSGGIRALAILTPERHLDAPEIPTAIEQGIDVVSTNMHFWWAPKGTDPAKITVLANSLKSALDTDAVRAKLKQSLTDPIFLIGDELQRELSVRERRIASVSGTAPRVLPNLHYYSLVGSLLLGILVCVFDRRRRGNTKDAVGIKVENKSNRQKQIDLSVFAALVCLYALTLQFRWCGFLLATFGFIAVTGGLLSVRGGKSVLPAVATALLLTR